MQYKESNFDFERITSIEIKYSISKKKKNILNGLWNPDNKKDKGVYFRLCKFEEFGFT